MNRIDIIIAVYSLLAVIFFIVAFKIKKESRYYPVKKRLLFGGILCIGLAIFLFFKSRY
jgi:hypothetical protein